MTEKETPELKLCPFCGGKAYFTRAVNGTMMAYVSCSPCGIQMKAQTHGYGDDIFPLSRDIVGAWNTRVDDSVRQENAALKEALDQIANDPHCSYENTESGSYGIGVTDGHRCAAIKACAALAGEK